MDQKWHQSGPHWHLHGNLEMDSIWKSRIEKKNMSSIELHVIFISILSAIINNRSVFIFSKILW